MLLPQYCFIFVLVSDIISRVKKWLALHILIYLFHMVKRESGCYFSVGYLFIILYVAVKLDIVTSMKDMLFPRQNVIRLLSLNYKILLLGGVLLFSVEVSPSDDLAIVFIFVDFKNSSERTPKRKCL